MTYIKLFWTFFKIGLFTFGGGYAMIPLVQQEVLHNEWLSRKELIDFIAISESTPGPFAINVSTFVGMQTAGILGAVCSTIGVALPSFVIILLVAKIYESFKKSKTVNGAMIGLKGAVVGLIGSAIISTLIAVFEDTIKAENTTEIIAEVIIIGGIALGIKKIPPIAMIIIAALVGIIVKAII